jgi:Zn-dependent protease with chaperone function
MRVLNLLAVPVWWSLSGALVELGTNQNSILDWPAWVHLVLPLSVGITMERLITNWTDRRIDGRRWTIADLFRISLWHSFSSTVPLLLFAVGIDALTSRSFFAILWIVGAGFLARFADEGLRAAMGLSFRRVKSGELFRQSYAMAQRMGVRLVGVFVYPTGRGRLMNAHSRGGLIGMTDVCVHLFHGAQLDFMIGHELAHAQQNHGLKELGIVAGAYSVVGIMALAVPHLPLVWHIFFKFCVILIPLLISYSVSRRYEFAADRAAVECTGEGEIAIRALVELSCRTGAPIKCCIFDELFLTHPSLRRRINAISRVGQVPMERVDGIWQQFTNSTGRFSG